MTQANATSSLTTAGLVVGTVTNASSATVAAGLVISQNPGGGSLVSAGSAVALLVSSGNPKASLSPSSLSFGNHRWLTTSAAKKVTLTNSGTGSLNLSGLTVSGKLCTCIRNDVHQNDNTLARSELLDLRYFQANVVRGEEWQRDDHRQRLQQPASRFSIG